MTEAQVRAEVEELESLLERIDDNGAATVAVLLRLYGEALRRVRAALDDASDVAAELGRDELVTHLFALHDLAPLTPVEVPAAIAFGPVVMT
jgi:hypothetical protein